MPRLAKVPTPPPPGCVWIQEASRLTGLSVKTLHNYRHLDKGPKPFPVGRKLAYPVEHIAAWLDEQRNPAPDAAAVHSSRPPEPRRLPHGPAQTRARRNLKPAA
ncbi:helix-turn-helix domain-containing protein [Streptomyces sp. NBC_00264]|uniref:helix-turn-helix transcriptional regulator n=1 Tax=unclassified Streptomyces TaxID=2593676 RepID=UPI002253F28E|nr:MULTISPECIES: helix-turn-helix domain-containing protein [unclassified Streptomyces]MCX5158143.1 helix-turn-helix domain-containing protein [Streptomyces sp. NBC_00305]MCX5216666.1 helix-turn-helix domain-containing protein [Streptomyces sp. NBC_00264]